MDEYSIGDEDYSIGEDLMGDDDEVIGSILRSGAVVPRKKIMTPKMARLQLGRMMQLPAKPDWREGQVAPGVWGPREGRELLPLSPESANGVFDPTNPSIRYRARPQRPFQPRRLIANVRRSAGAVGVQVRCGGIIIGTQVQMVEIADFDLEIFAGGNFGVGLKLTSCGPGIDVQLNCNVSPVVPAGETVAVSLAFIGSSIT